MVEIASKVRTYSISPGKKERKLYICIWNFKNLQFDGIVSKCSLVPSSGIIRQLMIIGES